MFLRQKNNFCATLQFFQQDNLTVVPRQKQAHGGIKLNFSVPPQCSFLCSECLLKIY
jgi:hypothetical protein